jgi:diphthine methyl ester acylhydrolase
MTLFDTRWPADSVEFCPHPNAPSLFACGTYKLEESAPLLESDDTGHDITVDARQPVQRRHGECLIFKTTTDLGDVLGL